MKTLAVVGTLTAVLLSCVASGAGARKVGTRPGGAGHGTALKASDKNQLAIFAQGCFWGSENRFRKLPGVVATAVGYTGGKTANPTYEEVSSHTTGHTEAVLVEFDPSKVTYAQLLAVFWGSHDPTTLNRQGPDEGTNYRSALYALDAEQLRQAQASREAEQAQLLSPITTEIALAGPFWIAEESHQQWDEKHGYESCPLPRRARRK